MTFREYPDRELMMLAVADRIASDLGQFLRRGEPASLCLPGGTTPGPVYDTLSGVDLDWSRVTVLPGDERCVPADSPRSNARLLRARLLTGRAAAARFLPLSLPEPDEAGALDRLCDAVRPHLPLSVVMLGMGEDMHTASLFPGGDRLAEALSPAAPPVVVMRAPGVPEPRVTLTAPVLAGAMHVHLVILGSAKRAALDRARGLDASVAPVRAVLDNATVHWAE
jgi:6-phosphogluconolactonase